MMLTPSIKPIKVNPRKPIHTFVLTPQIIRREPVCVDPLYLSLGSPEDAMSPPSRGYKESSRVQQSESMEGSPRKTHLSPDVDPVKRRTRGKENLSSHRSSSVESSQTEESEGDQPSGKTVSLSDASSFQLEKSTPRRSKSSKVVADEPTLDEDGSPSESKKGHSAYLFILNKSFLMKIALVAVILSIMISQFPETWLAFKNMIPWDQKTRLSRSEQLSKNITSLEEQLPQENPNFWNFIRKGIDYRLKEDPSSPAVILLIANTLKPDAVKTLSCIANQVARISSEILKGHGLDGDMISDALALKEDLLPEDDTHEVRSLLHNDLDNKLSTYGAVVVPYINTVAGQVVHTLHGFADDTNAPYKRAVIILTMGTTMDIEDKCLCSDKLAASIIDMSWSDLMEKDKSSLSSRISVNPLAVSPVQNVDQLPICASM